MRGVPHARLLHGMGTSTLTTKNAFTTARRDLSRVPSGLVQTHPRLNLFCWVGRCERSFSQIRFCVGSQWSLTFGRVQSSLATIKPNFKDPRGIRSGWNPFNSPNGQLTAVFLNGIKREPEIADLGSQGKKKRSKRGRERGKEEEGGAALSSWRMGELHHFHVQSSRSL